MGLFDSDNFDFEEILKMPLTQLETDFDFIKDLVTDPGEAFGNHQDAMTETQGYLGLNKDNKIVKNSDAIVGSIFGAVMAAPAIAGAMGGSAGAGASAGVGAGASAGTGIGASGFGMAANPFSIAATPVYSGMTYGTAGGAASSGLGMTTGATGMGTGFGSSGFGISAANPLSVAGAEGVLIPGSLGSASGGQVTSGVLGSETAALEGSSAANNKLARSVVQAGQDFANQKDPTMTQMQLAQDSFGYGSTASGRSDSGVLGDIRKNYQGILSNY